MTFLKSKRFKTALVLLAVALAIGGGFFAIKRVVVNGVSKVAMNHLSEFGLDFKTARSSLLHSEIEITGLRLNNPGKFPEKEFCTVSRIFIDYHFWPLLRGEFKMKKVDIEIENITFLRNMDGRSNLELLVGQARQMRNPEPGSVEVPVRSGGQVMPEVAGEQSAETSVSPVQAMPFKIGELSIRLGQVVFRDYSGGGPEPITFSMPVNRTITVTNVTDSTDLSEVMSEQLLGDTLDGFTSLSGMSSIPALSEPSPVNLTPEEAGEIGTAFQSIVSGEDAPIEGLDPEEAEEVRAEVNQVLESFSEQTGLPKEQLIEATAEMLDSMAAPANVEGAAE